MKIEFETDINDYQEARKFKSLIELILKHDNLDPSLTSFARSLQNQLNEFLANPKFAEFTDNASDDRYIATHDESVDENFISSLRKFFGPSKRELELSRQRQELISRAERAEASAFEALSETADVGRERDALKEKVKQLEAMLNTDSQTSEQPQ